MNYRPYCPGDFSQLYAIEQLCFQPPLRFPRNYMRRLVVRRTAATWIAERDGQMTGFAVIDWAVEAGQTVAYIQTLEVAPAHRNRGIATELLRHIESSARDAGAQVSWLHVAEGNAPAILLYEAQGYLLQGREENYYGQGIHALIFAKPLE